MLSIFNALLRIAQVQASTPDNMFAEVDLGALVKDVAEFYEPLTEEKNQVFAVEITSDSRFHGDRDLLFQALANLLDNAIKYTPEQGHINLTLEQTILR